MLALCVRWTVLVGICGLSAACASITEGTTQSVQVMTTPVSGADCQLENDKGTWSVRSPGSVEVSKAGGALNVTCRHPEAGAGHTKIDSSLAGMTFGNVLAGGIVGVIVDTSTGAAYSYPDTVTVNLSGNGAANSNASPSFQTVSSPPTPHAALMTEQQADQRLHELDTASPPLHRSTASGSVKDASIEVEITFWNSVKDSNDPALYEAYLRQYPHGNFAPIARVKFKQLVTAPRVAATPSVQSAVPPQPAPTAPKVPGTVARFSDSIDFSCPKAGTTIEFSDGATLIFADNSGFVCSYANRRGGAPMSATVFGNFDRAAQQELQRLWPLSVGKQVKFAFKPQIESEPYRAEFKVTGHEIVTVKAGSFDTFIIEGRVMSASGGNGRSIQAHDETITYWFAPALGYPVKVSHHLKNGTYPSGADREAVNVAGAHG